VPAVVAEVMAELGIDLTGARPRALTDDLVRTSDVVVTMGCGDICPVHLGTRYLDWDVDEPEGLSTGEVRALRQEVERLVLALLDEIVPPG
jgi:protein-tyrosine-phosphatase